MKKIYIIIAVFCVGLCCYFFADNMLNVRSVFSQGNNSFISKIIKKTEETNTTQRKYLIPGGQAFGVKFYTEGAIVVDISSFESDSGTVSPAKEAGIKVSDIIIAVNGQKITSNKDISNIVNASPGDCVNVTVKRNSQIFETTVQPERCVAQNAYRIGMWVRDSTAGIGTVTYYDPENGTFAGLGHGISDIDTGILMPMAQGEVIGATITGIAKGQKGSPGQLMGAFDETVVLGNLINNSEKGIQAQIGDNCPINEALLPIAFKSEIHEGEAQILCTVTNEGVRSYDAQIESISLLSGDTKNMVIRITDEKLLGITGGIIQGMSGSTILQDGKIVGAVTHVLVNDPTRGYGIFIENMIPE